MPGVSDVRYTLGPRAVRARALFLATSGTAVAVAPAWLVVVLIAELGLASRALLVAGGAAIGVLGIARGLASYALLRKRLAGLAIDADPGGLTVHTARSERRFPRETIARATDIDGSYGGLRLELTGPDPSPSRLDVPRGGDSFADLRARVSTWVPIERPRRRSRAARLALGVTVVLALFFVPFVVADARGSRAAVALVLLVAWGAMRAVVART